MRVPLDSLDTALFNVVPTNRRESDGPFTAHFLSALLGPLEKTVEALAFAPRKTEKRERVIGGSFRMKDEERVRGVRQVGIVLGERHDHVGQESHAPRMAGTHEVGEIAIGRWPTVNLREAELEVRREIVGSAVAPVAVVDAVGRRQELQCIDAELLDQIRRMAELLGRTIDASVGVSV